MVVHATQRLEEIVAEAAINQRLTAVTGVGIEPTTYGLKGTLRTGPNVAKCHTLRGKARHPATCFTA